MPQPKKHASTRARRNKASTAATLQPTTLDVGVVPELPELGPEIIDGQPIERDWHPLTRQWWVDVWTSPMSKEWHPATDMHNVFAAALHYNDMWRATSAADRQKADAAFQKREAALGLTPYDRRRLEWTIATAEDATSRSARRRQAGEASTAAAPKVGKADPRASLSVVS